MLPPYLTLEKREQLKEVVLFSDIKQNSQSFLVRDTWRLEDG